MKGKPACRIYLIRHGETANAGQVCFNGHFDVGLSDRGKEQFRQIAEALKEMPVRSVYCSDLQRTQGCARLIAEPHGLTPKACPELRELSFGLWEGLSVAEVNRKYPGQLKNRLENIETFQVEGGETFHQLSERVIPRFEEIVARHPGEEIVIVAHGGVNRVILGHLLAIPVKNIFRIHQDYAAVNVIQYYEDNPVVELIGGSGRFIPAAAVPDKKIAIQ